MGEIGQRSQLRLVQATDLKCALTAVAQDSDGMALGLEEGVGEDPEKASDYGGQWFL